MLDILSDGPILQIQLSAKIRRKYALSKQAFYSRLKSWLKNHIVEKSGDSIYLPRVRAVNESPYSVHLGLTNTRQENYCLKYKLKDPLSPNDPPIVLRSARIACSANTGMNNNAQADFIIEGLTARLDTNCLLLWAPHIYSTSDHHSIIMESQAKAILDPIAEKLERKLAKNASFTLVRIANGMLYSERVDIELEEEEHELAKAKPKGYKFEVHHPQDGRLRADIDFSRGVKRPEVALKHRKTAPNDRDTMNEQFNALFDGQVSLLEIPEIRALMSDMVQIGYKTDERLAESVKNINEYAKNINIHLPVLKSLQEREERQKEIDAKLVAILDVWLTMFPKKARQYIRTLDEKQKRLL